MIESSKYDFFMNELNSLEKQIYSFIQKNFELSEENKEFRKRINQLEKENEVQKLQLAEFEERISQLPVDTGLTDNPFNTEEREILRNKIDDLLNKIDFHLRS